MENESNSVMIILPDDEGFMWADVSDDVYLSWVDSESGQYATLSKENMRTKLEEAVEQVYRSTVEGVAERSGESEEDPQKDICLAVFLWRALRMGAPRGDITYCGDLICAGTIDELCIFSSAKLTWLSNELQKVCNTRAY